MGCWVVTLKDHEGRQQVVFEADCWADIPTQLEGLLGGGRLPWKPFKSYRKKERKLKPGE